MTDEEAYEAGRKSEEIREKWLKAVPKAARRYAAHINGKKCGDVTCSCHTGKNEKPNERG